MRPADHSGRYDVIVVGVGGMGSAAVYHLARRGKRVLGLERYGIPHSFGSSHGHTRIIRLAYYEDPSYVPLIQRAHELWRELEQTTSEKLLHTTGSIDAGSEGSWVFDGSWRSCRMHDLPHEVLTGAELRRRYPGYNLPPEHLALLQPDGGFLLPERCIVGHVTAAQALGAEVHGHEAVLDWESLEGGVRVRTSRGVYEAEKLVFTAGAWSQDMLGVLDGLAVPERQVLAWLQPTAPESFRPDNFPVFNLLVEEGRFYGFPVHGVPGFKFGKYHHLEERSRAEEVDWTVHDRDEELLRSFAARYFPDGCGPTMDLQACMFTNTPDRHFVMDLHPDYPQVSLASPCSGHGFKFASAVGEVMADLAEKGMTRHDIRLFGLDRLLGERRPAGATASAAGRDAARMPRSGRGFRRAGEVGTFW